MSFWPFKLLYRKIKINVCESAIYNHEETVLFISWAEEVILRKVNIPRQTLS